MAKGVKNKVTMCPRCGEFPALIDSRFGILPCKEKCQDEDNKIERIKAPEFYSTAKSDRVNEQRRNGAKDMLQPFEGKDSRVNPDFAKAYPERAKDYFRDDQLKRI